MKILINTEKISSEKGGKKGKYEIRDSSRNKNVQRDKYFWCLFSLLFLYLRVWQNAMQEKHIRHQDLHIGVGEILLRCRGRQKKCWWAEILKSCPWEK